MFRPPAVSAASRIKSGPDGNPTRVLAAFDDITGAPIWVPTVQVDAHPEYRIPPGGRKGWGVRGLSGDDAPATSMVVLGIAAGAFFAPKDKAFLGAALGGVIGGFLQNVV